MSKTEKLRKSTRHFVSVYDSVFFVNECKQNEDIEMQNLRW
jgi:hypothetical protein